ncbi:hypothetical protein Tco_1391309 [Tanacetum coccineum]
MSSPMNKEFNAFNKLESNMFCILQTELSKFIKTKMGKSVRMKVRKGMKEVRDKLKFCISTVDTNSQHIRDLQVQIKDMVSLLELAEVFKKANAEGREEKLEQSKKDDVQGEQKSDKKLDDAADDQENAAKNGEQSFLNLPRYPTPPREPTPLRDKRKGKGIATEEEPMKHLLPLIEQGGSDPNMLNLQKFSTFGKKMTLEEAEAQVSEIKRLAELKAEEEKSERSLIKIINPANIQAQAVKMAEYEAKRAKMLAEYNHYITYRADKRPIIKINYRIDRVSKDATMRIKRDNQPLSLVVFEKFGQLGYIQRTSPEAEEMIKKLEFTIEARNDVEQARKIVRDNLDDGGM